MFDRLQTRFEKVFRNLRGLGKIRESNIQEALEEVRSSLLEADVSYRMVQSFVDSVRAKSIGTEVLESVNPGQQFTKIVYDEMVSLLGGNNPAEVPTRRPFTILMVGLQGSGKTTTAAKLARFLRNERQYIPFLIPADTQRPAAREQLEQMAKENSMSVYVSREPSASKVVQGALEKVAAQEVAANLLVVDTAGRLHVDETLMDELREIRAIAKPNLVLYVLDSMSGQDAVRSAQTFNEKVGFDGVVVTKLDGDARGGAALSVCYATGKPIYFVGTGEKVETLEVFHPDRMASRILGMGDVVSFVEKAQSVINQEKAEELATKLRKNDFTIEDFQEQMKAVQKMGSFSDILGYLPGAGGIKKALENAGGLPEKDLERVDAIINSMTKQERRSPQVLDGSRRKRIANGSGTTVADVNRFIKQFLQTRTMMSRMSRLGAKGVQRGGFWQ